MPRFFKTILTASVAVGAVVLALASAASADMIYVFSSDAGPFSSGRGYPTSFGKIDSTTGVYTDIGPLPETVYGLAPSGTAGLFYTSRRDDGTQYFNTLTTSGALSGPLSNNLGSTSLQGLAYRDANSTLYAFLGDDSIGTVNTTNGTYTQLRGNAAFSYGARGGSLTSFNNTLYIIDDGENFGSVDPLTGVMTKIGDPDGVFSSMSLASSTTTLYGLVNKALYTIDPSTGVATFLRDINGAAYDSGTGLGLGEYFYGAAIDPSAGPNPVPEINPAGMGSVLALVTGALGLLERRRKQA